mmetsp:Transcript_24448/g.56837  ORF Transcript_24448/g.56837 Transcript_24448/m.56837 type:complete len:276 (-) Transcript_24448:423-1250(-)
MTIGNCSKGWARFKNAPTSLKCHWKSIADKSRCAAFLPSITAVYISAEPCTSRVLSSLPRAAFLWMDDKGMLRKTASLLRAMPSERLQKCWVSCSKSLLFMKDWLHQPATLTINTPLSCGLSSQTRGTAAPPEKSARTVEVCKFNAAITSINALQKYCWDTPACTTGTDSACKAMTLARKREHRTCARQPTAGFTICQGTWPTARTKTSIMITPRGSHVSNGRETPFTFNSRLKCIIGLLECACIPTSNSPTLTEATGALSGSMEALEAATPAST